MTLNRILKIIALIVLIVLRWSQHEWIDSWSPNQHFVAIAIQFLLFAFAANVAVMALSWLYRRRKGLKGRQADNVVIGLENIYYILLTIAAILTLFSLMGIAPQELLTSLSIAAAAIAIISKEFITDVISGIIISFSREISIDDYVKIGEHKGKVIDLTINKVALLNEDDDVIYIPNNKFYANEVVNYTKREIRKVNIEFEVNINSFTTIEELENDLIHTLADFKEHIAPNTFHLKIVDLRKDSLDLKFQYVVDRRDREIEREIRKKTVRQVLNYVKNNLAKSG